jgi:hypothetical protein
MDLKFFENDIFCQIFNIVLKKKLKDFFEEFFKNILKIFPKKKSQKQS